MAVQPLIRNDRYIGQLDSGPLLIAAGTRYTKFWVNIDNVDNGTGTATGAIMWSPDGSEGSWQTLTTISVEAPPADAAKNIRNLGYFDGHYYQTAGFFRVTADLPGLITVDASYEVTPA